MATIKVRDIANTLKAMIDQNGPSFLTDEPYQVYKELIESQVADRKTAAAILHVLVSEVMENIDLFYEAEQLSELIRRECCLNKKAADGLALVLYALYTGEHRKEWQEKEKKGLRSFLEKEFECTWEGFAVWDDGNGTVDCHYEAQIKLMPTERITDDEELLEQLEKNPFMTEEAIHNLFVKRLRKYLNYEFEDYCTCDDYYQPVVEDFSPNVDSGLREWCNKNGFEYISFEGDGEDEGYEPKHSKGWY